MLVVLQPFRVVWQKRVILFSTPAFVPISSRSRGKVNLANKFITLAKQNLANSSCRLTLFPISHSRDTEEAQDLGPGAHPELREERFCSGSHATTPVCSRRSRALDALQTAPFVKLSGSLILHFRMLRSTPSMSITKKKKRDILLFINRMEICSTLENKW